MERKKENEWHASPAVTAVVWVFALCFFVWVFLSFVYSPWD